MTFAFSRASIARLATVHINLQRVTQRALALSTIDFSVTQGRRTVDEQARLYGKGRSAAQMGAMKLPTSYARPAERRVTWTMNSNHLSGHAVDVAPFISGRLEWDENGRLGLWPRIASAFKLAARELNLKIEWGGDWTRNVDRPHFELKE